MIIACASVTECSQHGAGWITPFAHEEQWVEARVAMRQEGGDVVQSNALSCILSCRAVQVKKYKRSKREMKDK